MKKNSAFSLIELSIVILIIGILVAGVTQSSRLVKQFKLRTAQTLTQSSPAHSISGMILWYETTTESSFASSETENNLSLSTWYDINSQSISKNNASQSTTDSKPLYIENAINSLPVVRFDGSDDFMTFDGTNLVSTNYTIFIVGQRRVGITAIKAFMGGSGSSANTNLHIGYRDSDVVTHGHYSNDLNITVATYTQPTPTMHTFRFSTTDGKSYWENGGTDASDSNSGQTTALISYAGAALGRYLPTTNYFNGDIAEIIAFNRALKTEERQAVESYLGKKWGIKIS